jgi:plasmid stability protein
MRQVIARLDDELHERLELKAAAEGRSLNSLIVEALALAVRAPRDERAALRARRLSIVG